MALSANQKEEAYIQAFIKTLKDLAKDGGKLNGVQLKGIEGMTKWMTQMSNTNTTTKSANKIAKQSYDLGIKQQKLDLVKKKMDEVNIRLRHGYNIQEEKEHGDQVRRNIQLRQMHENFAQGFNMVKKSLFGGFGFQAAIGTTVKKMAGMTRNFSELEIATKKMKKADDEVNKATKTSLDAYNLDPNKDKDRDQKIKHADMKLNFAMKDQVRAKGNIKSASELAKGTQGKYSKQVFGKLSKLGEFLGKKAVPIGIGLGVAGVIMSIIVKAFSASPLFAAMMKIMKFMVQLILMPIGTFFGAILRPILIMLLRKFIIPWYSTMMPKAISIGTAVGTFLANPWEGLKKALFPEDGVVLNDEYYDSLDDPNINPNKFRPDDGGYDPDDPDNNRYDPNGEFISKETEEKKLFPWEQQPTGGGLINPAWGDDGMGGLTPKELEELQDKNAEQAKKDADLMGIAEETSTGELGDKTYQEHAEGKMIGSFGTMEGDGIKKTETESDYQKAREEIAKLEAAELARKTRMAEDQKALDEQLAKIERDKHVRQAAEMAAEKAAAAAAAVAHAEAVAKTLARSNAIFAAHGTGENSNYSNSNGQYSSSNNGQTGITPERGAQTLDGKGRLSSGAYANRGISEGAYEKASKSRGHVDTSASNKSNLKPETVALFKAMGIAGYAQGFDGMINSPTLFMAGEAGAEHVKVTPNGQGGGGGNITVNIQNMNAGDDDLRKLKKTILEVIQQSTNNRGRI